MQDVSRTAVALAVAALVPLAIFGTLQMSSTLRDARRDAQNDAIVRAREAMSAVDAELMGDLGALSVLASAYTVVNADVPGAYQRVADVVTARPDWANAVMTDLQLGAEVWETLRPMEGPQPIRPAISAYLAAETGPREAEVGDIALTPSGCLCVTLHQPVAIAGVPRFVLTVERRVDDLQAVVAARGRPTETVALVDRRGHFIARSLNPEQRIGRPATGYVREAVARGGEGVYRGVTLEGMRNQTAYVTSPRTGWSTHVASPAFPLTLMSAGSLGFTLLAAVSALAFAAGFGLLALRDLRRRRLAERARIQSQKLEAVGQFAGGVAHDFNNLLMIVIGVLNRLKASPREPREAELIDQGLSAADRGAQLTQQLLTFARAKPLDVVCLDLSACIGGVRELLAQSLGGGVELAIAIQDGARFARANRVQLELALINLAVNARDAMPKGGRFTVSTRPARERGMLELCVRDTGEGMSEDVAARAMEPFFTTKGEGKGTGLGLAQVHAVAVQSGGSVRINTAAGRGTEFVISLPACRAEETHAAPRPGETPARAEP